MGVYRKTYDGLSEESEDQRDRGGGGREGGRWDLGK